jgi:hypothetical protein
MLNSRIEKILSPSIEVNCASLVTDFTILNTLGQMVSQGKSIENKINVSKLNSGVYFLRLNVSNEIVVKRFVKD